MFAREMRLVERNAKADHESCLVGAVQFGAMQLVRVKQDAIAGFKIKCFGLGERHIVRHAALFGIVLRFAVFLQEDGQSVALPDAPESDPDIDAIVGAIQPGITMRAMGCELALSALLGKC